MIDIRGLLLQWFIKFVIKKFFATRVNKFANRAVKTKTMSNKELPEQLHKPIIKKFKKRKLYSPFIDNICGADLADMQLISKFNKRVSFLLCVIDIFSKYAWVIHLKDKQVSQLLMLFKKSWMNLIANQTKNGSKKEVNFMIHHEIIVSKKCHRNVFNT